MTYLILATVFFSIALGIVLCLAIQLIVDKIQNSKRLPKLKRLRIEKRLINRNAKIEKIYKEKAYLEELQKGEESDE